jgi:hypothetical protein
MRARSIKPGICDNELLGVADPFYTLLFERLWMMADREGRLEDRPLRIKAQAFPYRDGLDVEPMLAWLDEHGFIHRYTADANNYIQIVKFSEHQSPHVKEAPSKIKAPEEHRAKPIQAPYKAQPKPALAALTPSSLTPSSLTPDSGLLTPDSGSLRSPGAAAQRCPPGTEPAEFLEIRREYPSRGGGQRWGDALKFYRRRVSEGESPQAILAGVKRYAAYVKAAGIEATEKVQQAATFLGDNRGYLEPWKPPPKPETATERLLKNLNGTHDDNRVIEHDPDPQRIANW